MGWGNTDQLYLALGYCLFMLILAVIMGKYPPKRINSIYGYRTRLSMKNPATWKAGNEYASELMVRFCLYSFFIPPLCYFVFPEWNFIITVAGNSILIVLILYYTEKHLKEYFDKDGNPLK